MNEQTHSTEQEASPLAKDTLLNKLSTLDIEKLYEGDWIGPEGNRISFYPAPTRSNDEDEGFWIDVVPVNIPRFQVSSHGKVDESSPGQGSYRIHRAQDGTISLTYEYRSKRLLILRAHGKPRIPDNRGDNLEPRNASEAEAWWLVYTISAMEKQPK